MPRTSRKVRTYLDRDATLAVLDATLSQPDVGLARLGRQFGLGGSTVNGWLVPQYSRGAKLKPIVSEWFKEHGRQFRELRPQIRLCPELLVITSSEEGMFGPLDIGPATASIEIEGSPPFFNDKQRLPALEFTPKTPDDLLVLKTDIDHLIEKAEQAVTELKGTRDSLAVVMALQGDSLELAKAKTKIAELEHQVKLADKQTEVARSKSLSDRLVERFGRK